MSEKTITPEETTNINIEADKKIEEIEIPQSKLAIVAQIIAEGEAPIVDGKLLKVKLLSSDPDVTSPEFEIIRQAREELWAYLQDNKHKLIHTT